MAIADKKRIQIKLDKTLSEQGDALFNRLGLTPTAVVTAMYKRAVAEGKIPFDLELTPQERYDMAEDALVKTVSQLDVPMISGKKAVAEYLLGDDDDDY